jgi:hypothetical protein
MYGSFVACIQCGYYLSDAEQVVLRYEPRGQTVEPALEPEVETAVAA